MALASSTVEGADTKPIPKNISPTAMAMKDPNLSLFEKVYIVSSYPIILLGLPLIASRTRRLATSPFRWQTGKHRNPWRSDHNKRYGRWSPRICSVRDPQKSGFPKSFHVWPGSPVRRPCPHGRWHNRWYRAHGPGPGSP